MNIFNQINCQLNGKIIDRNHVRRFGSHPSKTIYVNNLNDTIASSTQKEVLENVFSKFGEIVTIKSFKSYYRRGQAWITFSDIRSAISAVENANATQVFGKTIRVTFAVSDSKSEKKSDELIHSPMIPKSISHRIKLYKQYLSQWLVNYKNNGISNTFGIDPRNKYLSTNNQVLYDKNYILGALNAGERKTMNFPANNCIEKSVNISMFKSDSSTAIRSQSQSNQRWSDTEFCKTNTVFVQIEVGTSNEKELLGLFEKLPGFKELRFISNRLHRQLIATSVYDSGCSISTNTEENVATLQGTQII
ncbi:U1 snrnp [Cryptosporidium felis]|nr:U1 snrnp [Cryptosporidium felis]